MRLSTFGALLCLALVSCRKDNPPQIPIGQGDGFGGADFDFAGVPEEIAPKPWPGVQTTADPNKRYLSPTDLKNAWLTTQLGAKHFAAWCYDVEPEEIAPALTAIKLKIKGP